MQHKTAKFSDMLGYRVQEIIGLKKGSDRVVFRMQAGPEFVMWHERDCCESVLVEDITGDLEDIIGSKILLAEETVSSVESVTGDTATATFYKLHTVKGDLCIRWMGESNGYYSETVSFGLLNLFWFPDGFKARSGNGV